MKDLDNVYTLIDQYLADEMNEEEKVKFERQLNEDSVLKEELELQKEINETILEEDVTDFANLLSEIDKKIYNESQVASGGSVRSLFGIQPQYFMAIAAAIAVIFGIVFFLNQSPLTADDIYSDYYLKDSKIQELSFGNVRAGNDNQDSLLLALKPLMNEAEAAYNEKKSTGYEAAIEILLELAAKDTNETRINRYTFYIGLCYLGLDQQLRAVEEFEKIIKDPTYGQDANWLRAIALFKAGESDQAKQSFFQISNENGFYGDKAKEIIKAMSWE